ncbi:MAG: signal recognition particle protein [Candidatus Aenigmarchaeota archaeon]|nr:signal recognition particle protein [Candidatus Aenigmarchaeota archaeon]
MVLDTLGAGLKDTLRRIAGLQTVDKESVEAIIRELQRSLLLADVDVRLVYELSARIKERVLKASLPAGLTLKEHFIKVFYDEMTGLLGAESAQLQLKPQKILLAGLFGSGKTSTAAKLAKWFASRGMQPAMVACDTFRPAAQEQLRQLGKQLGIPVYDKGKQPEDIAKHAIKEAKEAVLIFDSAGRDALDQELADEIKRLAKAVNADECILVIPADIGQAARKQAEEFNRLVGITGIIVTKLDGTAKGGGALAAAAATKSNVRFIAVGERPEDLETYDAKRFVARLIGYGDIQGLLEKAKDAGLSENQAKRIIGGAFTMQDFLDQIEGIQKMGALSKVAEMIPGFSHMKLPKDAMDVQEGKMKRWKFAIQSMTRQEREDPEIIKSQRIARIAKGSGISQAEVRELLRNYKKAKQILKLAKGGKAFKRGPFAQLAKQLGMGAE